MPRGRPSSPITADERRRHRRQQSCPCRARRWSAGCSAAARCCARSFSPTKLSRAITSETEIGKKPTIISRNGISARRRRSSAPYLRQTHRTAGGELRQEREQQCQDDHRRDDAPIAEAVAHFAPGDDQAGRRLSSIPVYPFPSPAVRQGKPHWRLSPAGPALRDRLEWRAE